MLVPTVTAETTVYSEGIQGALAEVRENYIVECESRRYENLVLGADVKVKSGTEEVYGDEIVYNSFSYYKAKYEGTEITADFRVDLASSELNAIVDSYNTAMEKLEADLQMKEEPNSASVLYSITLYLMYNNEIPLSEEMLLYHTTPGNMNGFNEEAKNIFVDTSRELLEEKAFDWVGMEVNVKEYNTLKITLEAKNPLTLKEITSNSVDGYFDDISYCIDDMSVSKRIVAKRGSVHKETYTVSAYVQGEISISTDDTVSEFYFTGEQLPECENDWRYSDETWQSISASMQIRVAGLPTDVPSSYLLLKKDGVRMESIESGTASLVGEVSMGNSYGYGYYNVYIVQFSEDGRCIDVIRRETTDLPIEFEVLEETKEIKAIVLVNDIMPWYKIALK